MPTSNPVVGVVFNSDENSIWRQKLHRQVELFTGRIDQPV